MSDNKLRNDHSEQEESSVDQPGNGRPRLESEAHSVATADRSLTDAEKRELLDSYPTAAACASNTDSNDAEAIEKSEANNSQKEKIGVVIDMAGEDKADIPPNGSADEAGEEQAKDTENDVLKISDDKDNDVLKIDDNKDDEVLKNSDDKDDDDFSTGDVVNDSVKNNNESNKESGDDDDYVAMFGEGDDAGTSAGGSSNNDNPVARKRQKLGDEARDSTTLVSAKQTKEDSAKTDSVALDLAKSKLSKWASRLFDPNRPRGLVEPPQVIPLNDEFLTAFGKREKEFDKSTGRDVEIDRSNLDEVTAIELEEEDADGQKKKIDEYEGCKVKITNIAYVTKLEDLTKKVQKYGSLVEVNLIMDKDNPENNIGKAYVTFELPECASDFVEKMNEKSFEGRPLRVALATSGQRRKKTPGKIVNSMARYWEKDISTKCFRCGEVGHMESNCTNEEKPKPCQLCAELGHDSWSCSRKNVCFNCGVPGHVSRECWERRGMPKRQVCGFCFQSGHHRWNCQPQWNVLSHGAKCLVCGQLGHFSCHPMRWHFGLKNNYCFNCGESGHHGIDCKRPTLDVCSKNNEVAMKEIERAEAFSLSEELANQQQARRGRRERDQPRGPSERGRRRDSYERDNRRNERPRAKSQPPPGGFRGQYDNRSVSEPQYSYNPSPSPPCSERRRGYSDSGGRGGERGRGQQRVSRERPRKRLSSSPKDQKRGYK